MVKTKKQNQPIENPNAKEIMASIRQEDFVGASTSTQAIKRQKTSENPNVKEIMASIGEDFVVASTSAQVGKHQKSTINFGPTRRDAIDDPTCFDNSGDSSESEEVANVATVKRHDVGVQTNIISIDTSELAKLKEEIKKDSKKMRSSIQYDLKKMENTMTLLLSTTNKSTCFSELQSKLGLEEPMSDLKTFYEFDNKVKINKELAITLHEFMSLKTKTKYLTDAISGVLNAIMTHELQILFSACGKPNKGISKEKFKVTQTYQVLKDCILQQFHDVNDKTILSKTSRWLASAPDRGGGRNAR